MWPEGSQAHCWHMVVCCPAVEFVELSQDQRPWHTFSQKPIAPTLQWDCSGWLSQERITDGWFNPSPGAQKLGSCWYCWYKLILKIRDYKRYWTFLFCSPSVTKGSCLLSLKGCTTISFGLTCLGCWSRSSPCATSNQLSCVTDLWKKTGIFSFFLPLQKCIMTHPILLQTKAGSHVVFLLPCFVIDVCLI